MSNLPQIFNYQEKEVRTVLKDGEPWFVAKDVCEVLDITDTWNATNRLSELMKGTHTISTPGGDQEMITVSEAGVYKLVFTSRKPEAEKFTDWLATEVIPSIRKHGLYATDDTLEKMIGSPEFGIRLLTEIKAEREKIKQVQEENAISKQIIGELQPKASYYDLILQNKTLMPITKIAKDYGMSGQAMNSLLHELGVQYKMGDAWLLYQKHASQGYTQSKTYAIDADKSKISTAWTQKGRLFIYDLLKNQKGILPVIETEHVANLRAV